MMSANKLLPIIIPLLMTVSLIAEAAVEIRAEDGLAVAVDKRGRITGLHCGRRSLTSPGGTPGGVWIDDLASPERERCLPFDVRRGDAEISGSAQDPAMGLQVSWTLRHCQDGLRWWLEVKDLSGDDRALTVRLVLPLSAPGAEWWTGLRRAVSPSGEGIQWLRRTPSGVAPDGYSSVYPFAAWQAGDVGVSLSLPPEAPRDVSFGADARSVFARFTLGLSRQVVVSPGGAVVMLDLHSVRGANAFRAAIAGYRQRHPECFRAADSGFGAWLCGLTVDDLEPWAKSTGLRVGWFRYRLAFRTSTEHDLSADARYAIGAYPFSIAMAKLRWPGPWPESLAAAETLIDRVGRSDFSGRFQGYWGGAESVRNSLLRDKQGRVQVHQWPRVIRSGQGHMLQFVLNPDPNLFGASGGAATAGRALLANTRNHLDRDRRIAGIYCDYLSDLARPFNYRRDHWHWTDYPLSVEQGASGPSLHNRFSLLEYLRQQRAELAAADPPRKLWCNGAKLFSGGVPFLVFAVDIVGFEWPLRDRDGDAAQLDWVRACSGPKPVVHTCNDDPARVIAFDDSPALEWWYRRFCFRGIPAVVRAALVDPHVRARHAPLMRRYLPIAIELQQAGWQPETHVKADDEGVWVERYGSLTEGRFFVAALNTRREAVKTRLVLDVDALGLAGRRLRWTETFTGERRDTEADAPVLEWRFAPRELTVRRVAPLDDDRQ